MARYSVSTHTGAGETPLVTLVDDVAGIQATVAPSRGAELAALSVRRADGTWLQVIDRALDFSEPAGDFTGRGMDLWPAVGRNVVPDAGDAKVEAPETARFRYKWNDTVYEVQCHGFLKSCALDVTESTASDDAASVVCTLHSKALPEAIQRQYPFEFTLKSTWTVRLGQVVHGISVTAGASAMPFSLGNHVSFKFPFVADGSSYTSGLLKGSVTQELNLTDGGLLNGATTPRPEFEEGLPLSAPTACNAVLGGVPDDKPAVLELVQPGVLGFRLEHGPVPDALKPYRCFVMWGEAEKQYICPEPWLGVPNSLNTGKGSVHLGAGETFEWTFSITPITF